MVADPHKSFFRYSSRHSQNTLKRFVSNPFFLYNYIPQKVFSSFGTPMHNKIVGHSKIPKTNFYFFSLVGGSLDALPLLGGPPWPVVWLGGAIATPEALPKQKISHIGFQSFQDKFIWFDNILFDERRWWWMRRMINYKKKEKKTKNK